MSRYVYSFKALGGSIRAGDSRRFGINLKEERDAIVSEIAQKAMNGAIKFAPTYVTKINKKPCHSISDYGGNLLLRSIARHLCRRYRIPLPNRNTIISSVIRTHTDATPMFIFRRDLKSFYETIPVKRLKEQLLTDRALSEGTRKYLNHFFTEFCPEDIGLPRGIGLSAVLAEFVMSKYDEKINHTPGVYRYFRFCDDMLIFASSDIGSDINPPKGMSFSVEKSEKLELPKWRRSPQNAVGNNQGFPSVPNLSLTYLGYKFEIAKGASDESRPIHISISDRKLKELKSKIYLSIKDHVKAPDFGLLRDRIRYLSGNYRVRRNGISAVKSSQFVKSGIYYSYKMRGLYSDSMISCEVHSDLEKLDSFYRFHLLSQKSRTGRMLVSSMLNHEREKMLSLSFKMGFVSKLGVRFNESRLHAIKSIWRNV